MFFRTARILRASGACECADMSEPEARAPSDHHIVFAARPGHSRS